MHSAAQEMVDRIDVPMRAFAEGYYENLISMYRYLDVRFRSQPFVFSFEKDAVSRTSNGRSPESYFVHTSNSHRLPPMRPQGIHPVVWILRTLYVAVWYFWWSFCCSMVPPTPASKTRECESLSEYIRRIKLPNHFVQFYLLPLLSSVATCSHKDLLQFPAKDLTDYKKRSAGKNHYTVAGVHEVQRRLGAGLDAKFSATVTKVEALPDGRLKVAWRMSELVVHDEIFDRVVLAVAPDVVGRIFETLEKAMKRIPSATVRNFVQGEGVTLSTDTNGLDRYLSTDEKKSDRHASRLARAAQTIHFRTSTSLGQTESIHVHPSGAMVTTCPLGDSASTQNVLCSAQFQRALRTPLSRRVVNNMFEKNLAYLPLLSDKESAWRNSDNNVWLVGGWCWDGMVLLEGCVVSAMRVARDFDVDVPWSSVDR